MKEVKIQLENSQLKELGIESEISYTLLRFNENQFIGYWFSNEGETITFYVGAQTFMCKNCNKYVEMFDSIINK